MSSKNHTKRNMKGSHRTKRMALMIMIGFIIWGGVTFWDQMEKSRVKASQLDILQSKLDDVTLHNEKLNHEVSRLNDDEYIEQKIRTELHYAKPDETIFFVPK